MNLNFEQSHSVSPLEAWFTLDETSIVSELKSIKKNSKKFVGLKSSIISMLQQTTSDRIRNAAAIALVDLGAVDATYDIIDVLQRPEVVKASGTLIYAVDELGVSMPLHVLARLLERGSYEARAQALFFFEENRIAQSSEDEWREGRKILDSLAISDDPETAEAGRLALDSLDAAERSSKT